MVYIRTVIHLVASWYNMVFILCLKIEAVLQVVGHVPSIAMDPLHI